MTKKSLAFCLLFLASIAGSAVSCKQGIGDSCQENSDCASGLCSMAVPRVCAPVDTGSGDDGEFDARLPADTGSGS